MGVATMQHYYNLYINTDVFKTITNTHSACNLLPWLSASELVMLIDYAITGEYNFDIINVSLGVINYTSSNVHIDSAIAIL